MADGAVIITGASRGIGAALSIELDRRGFTVAGLSRTGDPPLAAKIHHVSSRQCDATDEQQLRDASLGSQNKLAASNAQNNAGLHTNSKSQDLERADFNE